MSAVNVVAAPERFNASVLLDRNIDRGRAGKAAVHAVDRSLTYGELLARASRAGNLLRALGVAREERVLLVLDDTTAFPTVFLGAMRLGAVPVPVSTLDKADNFRHFVDDSYARVVVGDAGCMPMLREVLDGRDLTFVSARGPADGALDLEAELDGQSDELAPAPTHRDDMAFWLYSSGSTGRPKGVVHLHHDIEITCETYARQVLGIREDDVLFSTTKLQHAYGLGNGLSFPLHFGATAVLSAGPPKPDTLLSVLREHRPTVFFSVPALYGALVRAPGAEDASPRCGCACRPPRRSHPWSSTASRRASASRSSTGSARPRCSTSSARTCRAPSCAGARAARCRATSCGSSTRTGTPWTARRSAASRSAATAAPRSTGTSTRRRRPR